MRGIVAEINSKNAIILAQDGSFRKIKAAAHMTVGSEIDFNQPAGNVKITRLMTRVSAIAAAALFVIGIGYGAYSYAMPYSYIDVDINPSIELTTNIYDRIIKAEALNDDGKKLLSNSNLKNTRLDRGVTQLLNAAVEQGYLKNGIEVPGVDENEDVIENAVIFTVSSEDGRKSGELKKELTAVATREFEKGSVDSEVLVGEASVKQRDDARKLGVTPGKLALIDGVMEAEPELKIEELKKAAVKDLIKKANDKKVEKEKQKAEDEKQKAEDEKQRAAKEVERENSSSKNNGNKTGLKNGTDQMDQSVSMERTTVLEKLPEQESDRKGASESVQNDEGANQDKDDKNNKSVRNERNNKNHSNDMIKKDESNNQDTADAFKSEKQQRQQLKDELLDQMKNRKQDKVDKQSVDENENIIQNNDKNGTQKNKKDNGAVEQKNTNNGSKGSSSENGSGNKKGN